MALDVGREAGANVATGSFNAVVVTLLRDGSEFRRGRRDDSDRLGMRAAGEERHGKEQSG